MPKLSMDCIECGNTTIKEVTPEQLNLLQLRQEGFPEIPTLQDILPDWSPSERELLISGLCETCFDKIFKPTGETNNEEKE